MIIGLLAGLLPGRAADSSAFMFADSVVHAFDLHFYQDDWVDALEFNYEVGELYMPARVTYGTTVMESVGVRYKGNSSYLLSSGTIKKSFKFKFDKYRDGQLLYGLEKVNLNNCTNDPSFMREKIAYDISARYMPTPRAAYADLYVDGELIGLYTLVEQIDDFFLHRHFSPDTVYNLFKAGDNGANLVYTGMDQTGYYTSLELKTNENENDWSGLVAMIEGLNNTPAGEFAGVMTGHLDLDRVIRHLAFIMVFSHFDSYTGSGRNYYLYDYEGTGRFTILPWDMNEAFGSYSNNWNVYTQDAVTVSNAALRPLHAKIMAVDSLRQVYLSYIDGMLRGPAHPDSITARTDLLEPLIDAHVEADPNKLFSYSAFLENIDNETVAGLGIRKPGVTSFAQQRYDELSLQLDQYLGIAELPVSANVPDCCSVTWDGRTVSVEYRVTASGTPVTMELLDAGGTTAARLPDVLHEPGSYTRTFSAGSLPAGCYFLQVRISSASHLAKVFILH